VVSDRNLSQAAQIAVGRAVIRARAAKVPWKHLVAELGRTRMQLWRDARLARGKDVSDRQMLHLRPCGDRRSAA
jgi:hypothetical protein